MGEVYRARDTRIGRDVAIKVVPETFATSPERLQRFELEIRVTGTLNHPNIVAVYDLGSHEGVPYVVYELLEGQTLRVWMETHGRPGARKAADLALQTARGLAAAHEKGVVHRDLKPENLFVTTDGRLKILDFGLAKREGASEAAAAFGAGHPGLSALSTADGLTNPGARLGTLLYMSPEQVRGAPIDHRSDIFSFGVVLHEMVTGRPAFRRASVAETLAAILTEDPSEIPEPFSAPLRTLVWRCLEKSPAERFQSARDLAFALESVLAAVLSEGNPSRSSQALKPASQGRAWTTGWVAAAAVGALVVAALAGWALIPHERPSAATAPRQVTPRQVTSGPGVETDPALSPDGSLLAYSAVGPGGAALRLRDVRGGPELRLTDGPATDTSPAWFPDGSALAFVSSRDGREGIWKIHRLGGAPSRLLADARDPAVSPDGLRLAFARNSPSGHSRIGVVEIGRPETARLLTGDRDGDPLWDHRYPAWSPDGRSVCYSDILNLWIVGLQGGPARPLTRDDARDSQPSFAPDGRSVYFSSGREGTRAIWRVSLDGGSLQRITLGTGPESHPSVALAATTLAYTTHSSQPDLTLVDRASGERIRVPGPGPVEAPAFLPDGRGVVYGLNRGDDWDLWVQSLERGRPSGPPRQLTNEPGAEAVAAPTPDGQWIAYCRVLGSERHLWVVPAGGGTPRALVQDHANTIHPAWSPDGARLAFVSDRDGREHVYVAPAREGTVVGSATRLTAGEATDHFPAWSPDGRSVAFTREESEGADVWTVPADASAPPRRLTTGAEARSARFEPDGRGLLVSGAWGGRALVLRRVPVQGGPAEPLPHPIELCDTNVPIVFGLSPDGRWVAFDERQSRGHAWVLEAKDGRF
jgi:Tol biopolymer transport system component